MLPVREWIRAKPDDRPRLVVVVDTEEEFDWGTFRRDATSVTAMRSVHRFQEVCDEAGVRPTYVVDYPIATQAEAYAPLREFLDDGRAEIGAHLHPWVNPPLEEELTVPNTYAGNLERSLEQRKLRALMDAIQASFGMRPHIYKAGRYGIGPNTATILEEEGFEVDLSVSPSMDLRAEGGPDFSSATPRPFWFGVHRRLLEIPMTSAYIGWLRALGAPLHELGTRQPFRRLRLNGVLSRLGAVERLRLTPEGMDVTDNIRLVRALMRCGHRIFTYSLHSPSLAPGFTPYVRDAAQRESFLDSCRRFFDFFGRELGGEFVSPTALKRSLTGERDESPRSVAKG